MESLKEGLGEADHAVLTQLHAAVVTQLKGGGDDGDGEAAEKVEGLVARVRAMVAA